jgi:hypothetical protein
VKDERDALGWVIDSSTTRKARLGEATGDEPWLPPMECCHQWNGDRRGLGTAALVIGYLQLAVTVGVVGVVAILVALCAQ